MYLLSHKQFTITDYTTNIQINITERIIGLIDIPGRKKQHDAYRSELGGLYGIVTAVEILAEISKLKDGGIEIGCDGMSALNRSFWVDMDDISSR